MPSAASEPPLRSAARDCPTATVLFRTTEGSAAAVRSKVVAPAGAGPTAPRERFADTPNYGDTRVARSGQLTGLVRYFTKDTGQLHRRPVHPHINNLIRFTLFNHIILAAMSRQAPVPGDQAAVQAQVALPQAVEESGRSTELADHALHVQEGWSLR